MLQGYLSGKGHSISSFMGGKAGNMISPQYGAMISPQYNGLKDLLQQYKAHQQSINKFPNTPFTFKQTSEKPSLSMGMKNFSVSKFMNEPSKKNGIIDFTESTNLNQSSMKLN